MGGRLVFAGDFRQLRTCNGPFSCAFGDKGGGKDFFFFPIIRQGFSKLEYWSYGDMEGLSQGYHCASG